MKETTMIDPQKYIVFRRADFESAADAQMMRRVPAIELGDAVVLRLQDLHAAGALYAYASSILATHELLTALGFDENETAHLIEIADYFSGLADLARQNGKKVPTI
jgi:hypothetical protein